MDRFDDGDIELKFFVSDPFHRALGPAEMLDEIEKFGLRNSHLRAGGLGDEQIAKMSDEFGGQAHEIFPGIGLLRDDLQRRAEIRDKQRVGEVFHHLERREAEDIHHVLLGDVRATKRNHLVEHALGIAQPAIRASGEGFGGGIIELDLFAFRDVEQMFLDEPGRNPAEIETLATAGDGRRDFLRLGRREDEFHMRRRLLQCLEKGIERSSGEHVDLIDEVDFKFPAGWGVGRAFAEIADIFHAIVAGAVDFDDIQAAALGDLQTGIAFPARLGRDAFLAIEGLREDAGGGGLADSARADKEVGLREALRGHGILQGARDVVLPDHLGEGLRTVFAGEHAVTHGRTLERGAGAIQQDLFPKMTREF